MFIKQGAEGIHYQGKPCKEGHTRRYTRGGACVLCNHHRVKHWKRKKNGIPEPDYPNPGKCECCGEAKKQMHLDHDHKSGEFRGWLCNSCNTGIGGLGDNIVGIEKALAYLKRSEL